MYQSFFGFKEKPFSLRPDPAFLYLSKKHSTALSLLEYSLHDQAAFTVITGRAGLGKTTLIRALLARLGPGIAVGMLTNTHASYGELMRWVLLSFGIDHTADPVEAHERFVNHLIKQYAEGRRTLLIIDEAQNLGAPALEELRMLSNINADKDQLLQIMFSGQPPLRDLLRRPDLEQLAQRIAVDYDLSPLDSEDTAGYIQHRLRVAGGDETIFTADACREVHHHSGGIPRLVNMLCDQALVYAFASGAKVVNEALINEVIADRRAAGSLTWSEPRHRNNAPPDPSSKTEHVRETPSQTPAARQPVKNDAGSAPSGVATRAGSFSEPVRSGRVTHLAAASHVVELKPPADVRAVEPAIAAVAAQQAVTAPTVAPVPHEKSVRPAATADTASSSEAPVDEADLKPQQDSSDKRAKVAGDAKPRTSTALAPAAVRPAKVVQDTPPKTHPSTSGPAATAAITSALAAIPAAIGGRKRIMAYVIAAVVVLTLIGSTIAWFMQQRQAEITAEKEAAEQVEAARVSAEAQRNAALAEIETLRNERKTTQENITALERMQKQQQRALATRNKEVEQKLEAAAALPARVTELEDSLARERARLAEIEAAKAAAETKARAEAEARVKVEAEQKAREAPPAPPPVEEPPPSANAEQPAKFSSNPCSGPAARFLSTCKNTQP